MRRTCSLILLLFLFLQLLSQTTPGEWRVLPIERLPPDKRPSFYKLLCLPGGSIILSSTHGLIRYQGFRINFPAVSIMAEKNMPTEKVKDPHTEDGIKAICRGEGSNFFFLTASGRLYYIDENLIATTGWSKPPLYIPININNGKTISSIWTDEEGDLFVGITGDSLMIIPGAAKYSPADGKMDKDGNFSSDKILANSKKIFIGNTTDVFAFANDITNPANVLVATSHGLMRLKKKTGEISYLGNRWNDKKVITGVAADENGNIWFGTIDHGIGSYNIGSNKYFYYKGASDQNRGLTINSFCRKSGNELFVAVADSVPAIFNMLDHSFVFLSDTIFSRSNNNTTDIRVDRFGNLFAIKGGALYYNNSFSGSRIFSGIEEDSAAFAPFIYDLQINDKPYYEVIKSEKALPLLKEITLDDKHNKFEFSCSLYEFWDQRSTEIQWKIDGLIMDWVNTTGDGPDRFKAKFIPPLLPGKYVFRLRAKVGNEWRKQEAVLSIIITPPFWKTWWFWSLLGAIIITIGLLFYIRHLHITRRKKMEKLTHEKELIELEAKALRAQMNPHFVFNSLNSIKSLINKNENEKAVGYLATFSKLIRTLFQNSDNREVSLFEELETCKLYTQLEKMRFGDKVEFVFDIDETIDLKDFKVPALILQPFIENAIWHGLIPKEPGGRLIISIKKDNGAIQCIIDDNGIGRERSKQFKPQYEGTYQSKGIGLTQSRLELDKLLNEREDSIQIIDKKDKDGNSMGTKVILSFKEK